MTLERRDGSIERSIASYGPMRGPLAFRSLGGLLLALALVFAACHASRPRRIQTDGQDLFVLLLQKNEEECEILQGKISHGWEQSAFGGGGSWNSFPSDLFTDLTEQVAVARGRLQYLLDNEEQVGQGAAKQWRAGVHELLSAHAALCRVVIDPGSSFHSFGDNSTAARGAYSRAWREYRNWVTVPDARIHSLASQLAVDVVQIDEKAEQSFRRAEAARAAAERERIQRKQEAWQRQQERRREAERREAEVRRKMREAWSGRNDGGNRP